MNGANRYIGQHVLANIPEDLKALGWEWVSSESNVVTTLTSVRYKAVYVRLFERGVDNERLASHQNGTTWVRVSTNTRRSASWDDALRDGIELMQDADARRKSDLHGVVRSCG